MSFMLTTDQIRNKTKTVTRRLGWRFLKLGDILNACVKCQGLKKGEKIEKICQIRVTHVCRMPLYTIPHQDTVKEGFPEMSRGDFCLMFADEMKCDLETVVTRIEFEYLAGKSSPQNSPQSSPQSSPKNSQKKPKKL